jgi:microcystin-dependent protein
LSIASTSVLKAQASEPFLGQIAFVPYNFVPKTGLPVTDSFYQFRKIRLYFALLGTTYGGNGTTTFALPDMRGRVLVHEGQAPGGPTNYTMGQSGGTESVTLQVTQMPPHSHSKCCNRRRKSEFSYE